MQFVRKVMQTADVELNLKKKKLKKFRIFNFFFAFLG